jgi:hypothetical protein
MCQKHKTTCDIKAGGTASRWPRLEPFPFRLGLLAFCFDAFSLREPVPIPDQVRDRLSLENAL